MNLVETFVRLAQNTTQDQHDAVLAQALAAHHAPDADEVEIEARGALILADMHAGDSQ